MSAKDVLKMISDNEAKFVDFRFTDTHGKEQHVSVPSSVVDEDMLTEGKMFDGSSICSRVDFNFAMMANSSRTWSISGVFVAMPIRPTIRTAFSSAQSVSITRLITSSGENPNLVDSWAI